MNRYFDPNNYNFYVEPANIDDRDEHNDTLNSSFMAESMYELLNGNDGNQYEEKQAKPKDFNQSIFWESMKSGRIDS